MSDETWGHCKTCKHFGSPARRPLGAEEARCNAPALKPFALRVYGSNGCNQWELREGLSPDDQGRKYESLPLDHEGSTLQ